MTNGLPISLAELNERNIYFLTLRRRASSIVHQLNQRPLGDWKKIRLQNIGRKYATPRILEKSIAVQNYPEPLRQIAIKDLGHDKPTLLIVVRFTRRAHNTVLRTAGYVGPQGPISWMHDRNLIPEYM